MPELTDILSKTPIVPYVRGADYAVRKPWYIPERRLLDYLLVYIKEGECHLHAEGTDYILRSGDFCLVQPNDYHIIKGITNTVTPYIHLDFFFNPEREKSFPSPGGLVDLSEYNSLVQPRLNDFHNVRIPVKFTPSEPTPFRDTLMQMIGLWLDRNSFTVLKVQLLGTELLTMLLKDFSELDRPLVHSSQSLNWITSYFSLHLSEPLSVADMAAQAQLSPSRFAVLFREQFGLTPHQYLLQVRIQHARRLLDNSGLPMADIAEYCGFANVHHFSKVFKNINGHPPGYIRKTNTGQQRGGTQRTPDLV